MAGGLFKPFGDLRRHLGLPGIEAQQLLRAGELLTGLLTSFVEAGLLFGVLLFLRKFGLLFHSLQAVCWK